MTKLSVVIAMYNDEKYIERCLNSLVNQTNKDFDIICVDDASTDDTVSKCSAFLDQLPITIFRMPHNSGLSAVRQKGLFLSNCDYISFVDADDELASNYVEVAIDTMSSNHCDVCIFGVIYKYTKTINSPFHKTETKQISFEDIEHSFKEVVYECHLSDSWDKVYRKQFILDSNVSFCMDQGINGSDSLFNKMLFMHNPIVSFINEPLYIHYSNPNSMVTRPNKDFVKMAITMVERLNSEAELLKYKNVRQYNLMLFYSILRSDFINKIANKEMFNSSICRSKEYINTHSELRDKVVLNKSLTVFQYVLLKRTWLVKLYLRIYRILKKR